MSESLDFSAVELITVPVTYKGKEYMLEEASCDAARAYRNAVSQCRVYNSEGDVVGMKNLADCEPVLVSKCLFTKEDHLNVPQELILTWPSRVQKPIFDKAMEISQMVGARTPELELLQQALEQEGAPITAQALQEFVDGLEDNKYRALEGELTSIEEATKNS